MYIESSNSYSLRNYNNVVFNYNYINNGGGYEILSIHFYAIDENNNSTVIDSTMPIFASNGKASSTSGTITLSIPDAVKKMGNIRLRILFHYGNHQDATMEISNIHFTN